MFPLCIRFKSKKKPGRLFVMTLDCIVKERQEEQCTICDLRQINLSQQLCSALTTIENGKENGDPFKFTANLQDYQIIVSVNV